MTNKDIVIAFVDAWNRVDWETVGSFMAHDIVYQNIPWEAVHGKETVMANLATFNVEESDWIVHHTVAEGNVVMNERTDRVRMNGIWKQLRAMGVFVLRDGKITEWRDYFDPAELAVDIAPPQRQIL